MNTLLKNTLKYLLMLGLGGVLFWFVVKDLDPAKIASDFRGADYFWIIVSVLISMVAYWSRAVRWNLLLQPMDIRPTGFQSFLALMSGYFTNTFIPRGGEVTRCVMLGRMAGAPFEPTFGSVVAERIVDMLCLLLLIGTTVVLEFERISGIVSSFFAEKIEGLLHNLWILGLAAFFLIGMAGMLWFLRAQIRRNTVYIKVSAFAGGIWKGVLSIRTLEKRGQFLFHTLLIWVCYFFMTYTVCFALPATSGLGVTAGLVLLMMGGIGMSAPTPGGIGAFHILVAATLVMYGVKEDDGKLYALLIHTSQTLTVVIIGGISFTLSLFLSKQKTQEPVS